MSSFTNNTTTYKLNTGASIPAIGFGSFANNGESGYEAILAALKAGYRHIDTAAAYGNEEEVGRAIKDSGIPREELFITTKFWQTQHRDPKGALELSLKKLKLDYIDLFLIHWPYPQIAKSSKEEDLFANSGEEPIFDEEWDITKTWGLVQELITNHPELVKAVGVSNFSIKHLNKLLQAENFQITPAVNQVEINPLLPNSEVLRFCKEKGIVVEAYSPLGSSGRHFPNPFFKNEEINSIAKERGVSVAQLLINWGVKRGYVVLPKSSNPQRIADNLKDIKITDSEFERISGLIKTLGEHRTPTPAWIDFSNY
ncbi:hypothetical protein WICPIJ_003204 [Wickerhamomyces pijperi]|uniref:NADP-dependent oxidoreductase domain-containing protein n=1 Tax=Wickerhamomyces pijperi TaxID=599730 RepID=A0A9P8Q8B8_WICPI|nr:hypothetical protein WICPIJ_003204 [Wickerhamomyces pijperi]